MKSGNSYLILGVLMIALLLPNSALAAWRTGCVDCPRYFTSIESRSLALDSSGNPHIVYGGWDGVYHAYYDGLSWHIETVDNKVGGHPSIAIDASDKVHISYRDSYPNYALKYATNVFGSWVTETVDSDGFVGANSIAIDSSDKVHIIYDSFILHDLKYATNATGSWVTEIVDSDGVAGANSIAIDSSDKVHIIYDSFINHDLKYATNAIGSWVTEIVDSDGVSRENNSIAIDSLDKVHISYIYYSGYPDYIKVLKYATNASGLWVTETVDSDGWLGSNTSIVIDSSDNVYISYYDVYPNKAFKYTTNASGSWVTQIEVGWVGNNYSLAIDSSDNVHIIYIVPINEFSEYDLKYAVNSSGSWVNETVDSSRKAKKYASVAIDSRDKIHIGYVSDQGLMYMTNASGSWVTQIADSNADIYRYPYITTYKPSIAVDSSGNAHITYSYYVLGLDYPLKYATNASGSWVVETIGFNIGNTYPSIAIDSSDNIHISYSYSIYYGYLGVDSLIYITNASGSWVTETVDEEGDPYTSIAIDSSDKVHISYSFAHISELYGGYILDYVLTKYATNASGSWIIEIVDENESDIGYGAVFPSIAIDSADNAHISYSYYDGYSDHALKYATNASGSWVAEIVDSNGGDASSIAIDSTDNVNISYVSNQGLMYMTNASGLWEFETVVNKGTPDSMAMDSSDNVYIVYYDSVHYDLRYATNKPFPHISVTDSVDPADDLLIPFGEVRGGRRVRQTATVTNIADSGSEDLVISAVYLTGANPEQFYIRKDNCSNTALSSSESCTIQVVFTPEEAGVYSARIGIDSNDFDTPELYVELTGTSVAKRKQGRK